MATLDVLTIDEAADAVDVPGQSSSKLGATVTAVSRRLDELVGPIVVRTIADERHPFSNGRCSIAARRFPIASVTTATEYDAGGAATVLTVETATSKPADSFLLRPTLAEPELGLFGPAVYRRAGGREATFEQEIVLTYEAGRFATTQDVDERYKEAARITLANLWQRVAPGTGNITGDYDVPRFPFPMFAVPRSAKELLLDVWQDRAGTLGIA
jgi:hypothetical protein